MNKTKQTELYKTILDSLADPIIVFNNKLQIIYINSYAEKILEWHLNDQIKINNYKYDNIINTKYIIRIDQEIKDRIYQFSKDIKIDFSISILFNDEEKVGFKLNLKAKDESNKKSIAEKEGNISISEILNCIQEGICIIDKEFNIIKVNNAIEKLPVSNNNFIGRKCYDVFHQRKSLCIACPAQRTFETGKKQFDLIPLIRNERIIRWFEVYTFPLVDSKTNNIKAVVEYIKNVTDQKKIEEALQESETRFRALVSTSNDFIWELNEYGIFTYASQKVKEIIDYYPEEIMGVKTPFDLMPEEEAKIFSKSSVEFLKKPKAFSGVEHSFVSKNGEIIFLETSGVPIYDSKGIFIGFRGISRNINDKKRIEEELIKIQKIESIGLIAKSIAHDFNNYLTVILANTAILKNSKDNKHINERLTDIEKTSQKAKEMIKQLMSFSNGEIETKRILSLSSIIKEIQSIIVNDSNIELSLRIPDDLCQTEGDNILLSRAIHNLVFNSIQAMPSGGLIEITCENITINEKEHLPIKNGNYVKITIKDSGVGIEKKDISKIFDPYYTTKPYGTGLGLPITFYIIKNHNGYIKVESSVGVGTTFYIYLPAFDEKIKD